VSRKFGCKSGMITGMGSLFRMSCKREVGVSGIITDDSVTLYLDKWEFEVVGGTRGTADRGGVS